MHIGFDISQTGAAKAGCGFFPRAQAARFDRGASCTELLNLYQEAAASPKRFAAVAR